ncbi:hypothetical protein ACTJJB_05465 [Chitinophaga sp. 22536]|uniref:hypothetical protein n=1 Tax=unclassified Chitinophaga TaxID=2619133 RepID=UPI003F832CD6
MRSAFLFLQELILLAIIFAYLAGVAAAAESAAGALAAESAAGATAAAAESVTAGATGAAFIVSTVVAVESAAGVLPPLQATKNIPAAIANTNTFFIFSLFYFFKTAAKV